MRIPGKRGSDDGLLGLDFIIGFTVFMIALIFVAVMISGLLVHLQSRTIDYDAVAYRTSVVLVEDSGEPTNWQIINISVPAERKNVKRLGLTVDKNYPEILRSDKVNKFFNNSSPPGCYGKDQFCIPEDYRQRLIFGDYPYRFNISLKGLGPTPLTKSVGESIPINTPIGFVKRIVKIKINNATLNISLTPQPNLTSNKTIIRIDFTDLYSRPSPYQIDPLAESLVIRFNTSGSVPLNITDAEICTFPLVGIPGCVKADAYENFPRMNIYVDGNLSDPPQTVTNNVTVIIDNGYFERVGFDRFNAVDTRLTFDENVTNESLYFYNYTTVNPLPWLEPAVMEVRVW